MLKNTRLLLSLLIVTAIGLSVAAAVVLPSAYSVRTVSSGQALIRSDFELVNHRGDTVTDKSFEGLWQLVFFGFTYCPDVCPTTLAAMTEVLDQLGGNAAKVAPLFISVDPERDTPKALAEYVAAFHPSIVGLTGSHVQVQHAVKSFRVFASRVEQADAPDGYLMNHSGFIYLMRPDGVYEAHFTEKADPPEKIAAAIRSKLR